MTHFGYLGFLSISKYMHMLLFPVLQMFVTILEGRKQKEWPAGKGGMKQD